MVIFDVTTPKPKQNKYPTFLPFHKLETSLSPPPQNLRFTPSIDKESSSLTAQHTMGNNKLTDNLSKNVITLPDNPTYHEYHLWRTQVVIHCKGYNVAALLDLDADQIPDNSQN